MCYRAHCIVCVVLLMWHPWRRNIIENKLSPNNRSSAKAFHLEGMRRRILSYDVNGAASLVNVAVASGAGEAVIVVRRTRNQSRWQLNH